MKNRPYKHITTTLLLVFIHMIVLAFVSGKNSKNDIRNFQLKGKVKSLTDERSKYTFDTKGNIIDEYQYNKKDSCFTKTNSIENKYDKRGNLLEEQVYCNGSSGLTMGSRISYEYDKHNNVIAKHKYYGDGLLDEKIIYQYKNSQCEAYRYLHIPDSVFFKIVSQFDKQGYIIKQLQYRRDTLISNVIYQYNKKKLLIEMKVFSLNEVILRTDKWQYDKQGNSIVHIRYDSSGKIILTQRERYDYDEIGNWITNEYIEDGTSKRIVTRRIEYY